MSIIEEALRKLDGQVCPARFQAIKYGRPNRKVLFIAIAAIVSVGAIVFAMINKKINISDENQSLSEAPELYPSMVAHPVAQTAPKADIQPVLQGIVSGTAAESVAIINNLIMKNGDSKNGITILDIHKDRVKILYRGEEVILNLEG